MRPAGFRLSEQHKKRISESKKGNRFGVGNRANKGRVLSLATREKISKAKRGSKSSSWRGGISKLDKIIRSSYHYQLYRQTILIRDNFTCQDCKVRGGNLHAHHLKEFALIIKENNIKTLDDALSCEELWEISNGITLCESCHRKRHRKALP